MRSHTQSQYFARIDHAKRFDWQTADPFIRERELQVLKPLTEAIKELEKVSGRSPLILESGSGEGANLRLLQFVLGERYDIKGIDISPEAVAEAEQRNLDVSLGDGMSLPFPDEIFDVVFCRDVLHHLADDRQRLGYLSEMKRVCRAGGLVVVIEPDIHNIWMFGFALFVAEEKGLRNFTEARLKGLLKPDAVSRTSPSMLWRAVRHYNSPVSRSPSMRKASEWLVRRWEAVCSRITPTRYWAYCFFGWNKE